MSEAVDDSTQDKALREEILGVLQKLSAQVESAPDVNLGARLSAIRSSIDQLKRMAASLFADDWEPGERSALVAAQTLAQQQPSPTYLAFLDALGFSNLVTSRWSAAVERYDSMVDQLFTTVDIWTEMLRDRGRPAPRVRMFSDSVIITSESLDAVVALARSAIQGAHRARLLLRGCIAQGDHVEVDAGPHELVISAPLVAAAKLEAVANFPRVVLHPSIPPQPWWYAPPGQIQQQRNFQRAIVYKDGYWMVNPFDLMWARSGAEYALELRAECTNSRHREKCDWLLDLYRDVVATHPLIPLGSEWKHRLLDWLFYARVPNSIRLPVLNGLMQSAPLPAELRVGMTNEGQSV